MRFTVFNRRTRGLSGHSLMQLPIVFSAVYFFVVGCAVAATGCGGESEQDVDEGDGGLVDGLSESSWETSTGDKDGDLLESTADVFGADADSGEDGDLGDGDADALVDALVDVSVDVSKDAPTDVSKDVLADVPGDVAPDVEQPLDSKRTFDDDLVGKCPSSARYWGQVTVDNVTVGGKTQRAVRVQDTSSDSMSRVIFDYGARSARRFVFDLFFRGRNATTILAVHGTGAAEQTGTWRLSLRPDASSDGVSTAVWDGSKWWDMGTLPGAAPMNAWSRVTVDASTTTVSVVAGAKRVWSSRKAAVASDIKGIEFASSGTVPVGTDTYIDNLGMRDMGWVLARETSPNEIRFPDIVKRKDGRLLAVYQAAAAHTGVECNQSSIKMVMSKDGGRSWSSPTIAANLTGLDDRDPKVAVLADGTVVLNWFVDNWRSKEEYDNIGLYTALMAPSADEFGVPTKVETSTGKGFSHAPVVQTSGGNLLLPYYLNGVRVIGSSDGGKSWNKASDRLVVKNTTQNSYVEPNIVRLESGELIMVIRTRDGKNEVESVLVRSKNDGATWSAPEVTGYATSSHHLLATAEGKVLMTFGSRAIDTRPTYGVLISNPSGAWNAESYRAQLLYNANVADQANPSSVQVRTKEYYYLGYNVKKMELYGFIADDTFFW